MVFSWLSMEEIKLAIKKLNKKKLEEFKQHFENEKNKLIKQIISKSEEELDVDGDETDIIQGNVLYSVSNELSGRDKIKLQKISNALDRIASGTFGICEYCEGSIGEKRLKAMPEISICIDCAEEEEENNKQYA